MIDICISLQLLVSLVMIIIFILDNCTSLKRVVKEQTHATLVKYLKADTNTPIVIICSAMLLYQQAPLSDLQDGHWPQRVFDTMNDLLKNTEYDEQRKYYYFRAIPGDPDSAKIPFCRLMMCLRGLTQICNIKKCLENNVHILSKVLENGTDTGRSSTTKILQTVQSHSCTRCGDLTWISKLLEGCQITAL